LENKPFVLFTDTVSSQFGSNRSLDIIANALIKSTSAFLKLPEEKQVEIKQKWTTFKQDGGGIIPDDLNTYIAYLEQQGIITTVKILEEQGNKFIPASST